MMKTYLGQFKALRGKSQPLVEHCERVQDLTLRLADALGLRKETQNCLADAALYHDIGKLPFAVRYLETTSLFTERERQEMKRHPVDGYHILLRNGFSQESALIVLHHHERWDGSGYPLGLKEEEIPLGSRLIAIADSYDAMITRPYKSITPEIAQGLLAHDAGTHFQPALVEAFLTHVLSSGKEDA